MSREEHQDAEDQGQDAKGKRADRRDGVGPSSVWLALVLALAWGLLPALPALSRGELLGHPYTDLYPSVWGLWGFVQAQPGLPGDTALLGFPEGMGFYYSSPLKGWLAWPLLPLLGLTATWNLLTLGARVATVLAAWAAGRAWGLKGPGSLVVAAVYGCSPFFQGYAVEGIVEGTDGWTLALLVWALGSRRPVAGALFLGLTIASSWYLGMVGCLLVLLAALRDPRALSALTGVALALPFLVQFGGAFPGTEPLADELRGAMGAPLSLLPSPGLATGLHPFAITAWVGFVVPVVAVLSRSPYALLALVPALLSLGVGPVYDLPVAELVRFPYRWHAGTLMLLGLAAGVWADRRRAWWLAPLVVLEGLLLSPIEPVLPGAPAEIAPAYAQVEGPTLVLPGPVAMAPGEINRSRPRARYLLYAQTLHGQPSPWVPDFNSVGVVRDDSWLDPWRSYDKLEGTEEVPVGRAELRALRERGVVGLLIEERELGRAASKRLRARLESAGSKLIFEEADRSLWSTSPG